MRMHINKSRHNSHAFGIDCFCCGPVLKFANADDFPILHRYIAVEPAVAGAIDDAAVFDEQVSDG